MVLLVFWSWSLVARWALATGALCANDFLLLLGSLLLLLLVAMVAAWGAAGLRCY